MEFNERWLGEIMPSLPTSKRLAYASMLDICMSEFSINNERRCAAFLANLAHESRDLTHWEENLNYSSKRLVEVWPKRFPSIMAAKPYSHNPQALANRVYAGRMGNDQLGDGWKYRGRFPLQITGKDMYRKASVALNIPALLSDPDSFNFDSSINDQMVGFRVSAWVFAREKAGNHFADKQQLTALTKAINGGLNGLKERVILYKRGLRVLPRNFRLTSDAFITEEDKVFQIT